MIWRLILMIVALTAALVELPPDGVEHVYSNGLYPMLQAPMTSLSNKVGFALFDLWLAVILSGWSVLFIADLLRRQSWVQRLGRMTIRTLTFGAAIYLLFLTTWGLNYRRVPLEDKLALDSKVVTSSRLTELAAQSVRELNRLYRAPDAPPAADVIDPALASAFGDIQRRLGMSRLAVPGRPKRTLLEPYFRAASIDGMTDPFFLETMTQGALLPIEQPMTVAHEWAHLAGFADEGEANFVGWLVCRGATRASQYSGWLFLYGETMPGLEPSERTRVAAELQTGPKEDLAAIAARVRRQVRPALSAVGWRVYDGYLRANGVEQGTRSYTDVVRLILGTSLGSAALSGEGPLSHATGAAERTGRQP